MLRILAQQRKLFKNLQPLITRTVSQQTTTQHVNAGKQHWDLMAGVLVEQLPIITKSLNKLESEFQELLLQIEFENSLKSDHELQHERELQMAKNIKSGQIMETESDENAKKATAQDKEDAYKEEFKAFKPAPRGQEETLYLLVEEQLGKQQHFLLPQGKRIEGESMRQTAERVLKEKCGNNIIVQFYGNAPCGFYKYKYPTDVRQESIGAKIFFYRAILQKGEPTKTKFVWLPKSELENKVKNPNYLESINKFLF